MIEERILVCLDNLITNIYKINKNVHNSHIGEYIYNILMGNDSNSKRIFFDNFKNAPTDNKNTIVHFSIATIINRVYTIVNNVDINKIESITNYIDNTNRHIISNIPIIIRNEKYDELPEELKIIQTLNPYEKLFVISLCTNIMSFSPKTIIWDINLIRQNKDTFFENIDKYINLIIQLLNFYTPIYNEINKIDNTNTLLSVEVNKHYIQVTLLTEFLENIIKSKTKESAYFRKYHKNEIIYYMIYQFLLCKDDIEDVDIKLINIVYEILQDDTPNIDIETFEKLLKYHKFATEYYSLEDKIAKIELYRQQDLNEMLNTYADMDIVRYKQLQKRKRLLVLNSIKKTLKSTQSFFVFT